jgi:hypothetical protein
MKIRKILTKTLLFFPFYSIVVFIYNFVFYRDGFSLEILLIPFLLSVFTIYFNVFDYDKFNDLPTKEYLESKHTTTVKYSEEAWNICKRYDIHLVNYNAEAIQFSKDVIEFKIKFNILIGQLNSILAFKHRNDKIEISIKKQYITFLPDRGVNLKIIRQVEKKLKFYAEYG